MPSWIGTAIKIFLYSLGICVLVIMFSMFISMLVSDSIFTKERITTEAPLVAISTSSGIEGSTEGNLLGLTADSSTGMYFTFYLRNTDGSLQLHRALAADNRVFIMEDVQSIDDAYVRVTLWYRIYPSYALLGNGKKITSEPVIIENFANFTKSRNSYGLARLEIHLPLGTIMPTFDANIQ